MSGPSTQFDREEEQIERDYADGLMSRSEYNAALSELRRDYRAAADEASWDAFDRERECW